MVVLTWDREGRDDPTSETIAGVLKIFGSDMDHDAVNRRQRRINEPTIENCVIFAVQFTVGEN